MIFLVFCRFEFSVSMVELHRRTLDVAVKNGGSILSKHKGLLGKVTLIFYPFVYLFYFFNGIGHAAKSWGLVSPG